MTEHRNPPDQAAREAALDPARSFIVQAPAGSGKTGLLTRRYLRLLATVERPDQVLAVTFTRKAAAEMRNRILEALAQAGRPAEQAHERQLRALARAVRARDAERGWRIGEHPAQLRIQTIDSFNAELTRQLPLLSKFGAQPQTTERAAALYEEAARRTLDMLEGDDANARAVETLLRHLDNDWQRARELLIAMLPRRDQWLPRLGFAGGDARPDRAALEAALAREVEHQLRRVRDAVPDGYADEIATLAAHAARRLQEADKDSPLAACADMQTLPPPEPNALPTWRGMVELLLTAEGKWRRRYTKNEGFPPEDRDEKARVQEMVRLLGDDDDLRERLHALRRLPEPRFRDDQWDLLEALVGLLPVAVAQLQLVFGERGEVDFTEMALRAQEALGAPDAPTDLALRLDLRIRHILVDEFQDTSLSQYRLLELLTAGWEAGDGRSLFVVGDPMQSIYRFREAEVGLYLSARREGIGGVRLEPLRLSANFRSRPAVVDWVNRGFAAVLPAAEDLASGAVPYAPAVAQRTAAAGSGVYVHPQLDRDAAAEARAVLECLETLRREQPQARIAVLVQARSHLAAILPLLRRRGLRYRAVEIERLGFQPAVQDLQALTRALVHPADRTAWLAVLRAPWCGLTLADLHAVAVADEEAAIPEILGADPPPPGLSADGRARLARIWPLLREALEERQRRGLRDSVEALWLQLGGPATLADAVALDDAAAFFELLEELEAGGDLAEPAELEERLGEMFAPADPEADESLQVLTVHKAKGLEFDVVLAPGLGRAPRRDENRLLLWLERPRGGGRADLLLAPLGPKGGEPDPVYALVRDLEAERGRHERGRLLYVTVTRARESLHLFGHVEVKLDREGKPEAVKPSKGSALAALWPAVEEDYRAALAGYRPAESAAAEAAPVFGPWRLPRDWRAPQLPPPVEGALPAESLSEPGAPLEFSWAGETARLTGTLVHRVLQQMAGTRAADWTPARIAALAPVFEGLLVQYGVPRTEREAALARARRILERLPGDARARWLLFTEHRDARAEYALDWWDGDTLRSAVLDRTFIDADGVRWIVDYKTGGHEGGNLEKFLADERARYREQLERYACLMQAREPGRPVRVALYYPLLGAFLDWAPATD